MKGEIVRYYNRFEEKFKDGKIVAWYDPLGYYIVRPWQSKRIVAIGHVNIIDVIHKDPERKRPPVWACRYAYPLGPIWKGDRVLFYWNREWVPSLQRRYLLPKDEKIYFGEVMGTYKPDIYDVEDLETGERIKKLSAWFIYKKRKQRRCEICKRQIPMVDIKLDATEYYCPADEKLDLPEVFEMWQHLKQINTNDDWGRNFYDDMKQRYLEKIEELKKKYHSQPISFFKKYS